MTTVAIVCRHCQTVAQKERGAVNRARRQFGPNAPIYCSRRCVGLSRRLHRSKAEQVARKSDYDTKYRAKNRTRLKRQKAARFRATYDPEVARVQRRKRQADHRAYIAAYNANPKHKAKKRRYDRRLRKMEYGEYGQAWALLLQLERLIRRRSPDKYERLKARGYYDRINLERKRHRGNQ